MKSQIPIAAHACCSTEKRNLEAVIKACDYCSTSYRQHRACYRRAAKASGQQSRECLSEEISA